MAENSSAPVVRKKKDYNNGKVYKITVDGSNLVYFGSTCQTLCKRMGEHRRNYRSWTSGKFNFVTVFKLFDIGNPIITLLEDFPCDREEQLVARERSYMDTYECVNKVRPGRTPAEYQNDHRVEIAARDAEYYKANRGKIAEYYKTNREEIATQRSEYYKTNREKIAARQAEYRKDNHEKIATLAATPFTCECGSILRKDYKSQHMQSKKHINYVSAIAERDHVPASAQIGTM